MSGGGGRVVVGWQCACGEKREAPSRYSSLRVGVSSWGQGGRLHMWLSSWRPPCVKGVRQSHHTTIPSLIVSGMGRVGLCPGGRVWV